MGIEEIKKMKFNLERTLRIQLNEFQDKTGVNIEKMTFERVMTEGNNNYIRQVILDVII